MRVVFSCLQLVALSEAPCSSCSRASFARRVRLHPVALMIWLHVRPSRSNAAIAALREVLADAPVEPRRLRPRGALGLAPATILVVLARDRGEDVEHHVVHGREHAGCERVLRRGETPRGRQIERDDADLPRLDLGAQLHPVRRGEAGQAVDLFDKKDVAGLAVGEEPEELGPIELRTALVLDVARRDA